MKLSSKLGLFTFAVTGIVLACGPFYQVRALDEEAFVLQPINSSVSELFPKNKLEWDRHAEYARLSERRKATLKADLADLKLAAPQLAPEAFATYEKQRIKMLLSEDVNVYRKFDDSAFNTDAVMLKQLPEEFQLYLHAAVAHLSDQGKEANRLWKELLNLPEKDRKYRTVWALWMLAITEKENGLTHFNEIKKLVAKGFPDSMDLLDNTDGWTAFFSYRAGHYVAAAKIYYQQGATNKIDSYTAARSIDKALYLGLTSSDENFLPSAAGDPHISLALSYLLADFHDDRWWTFEEISQRKELSETSLANKELILDWLKLLTEVKDRDVSQEISLVAVSLYNGGYTEEVAACLQKVEKETAFKLWLLAKIAAKDGELQQSAHYYKKLLPLLDGEVDNVEPFIYGIPSNNSRDESNNRRLFYVYSEYAAVELGLKNYTKALDLFLQINSDDAAYIAESLMSAQELLTYMRESKLAQKSDWMRELLGRKLARADYLKDARDYLPKDHLKRFDAYVTAYRNGLNAKLPVNQRVQGFIDAADLRIRENFQLENGSRPQLRIYGAGQKFFHENYQPWRDMDALTIIPAITEDEKQRLQKHYRRYSKVTITQYDSAEILYRAASLLPNNNNQAAGLLNRAGLLTALDPPIADKYYKTLVRKHGKTELGKAADEKRWFIGL